jgi:alkanesulfonate monooxygenase SsuD/methylene tetrahydromethanopterin reductase-like flavin-dependent oxidoreductase (luciferase family)
MSSVHHETPAPDPGLSARHPWVAEADHGPRFGVLLTGARGLTTPTGPEHGWLMHDDPLDTICRTARIVEDAGLDAVFVPDTPRLFPDPLVTLASLAATTSSVRLGSLVIVYAFRHPALLARMTADVDRLSDGRLILGLGIGETERQFATVDAAWGTIPERRAVLRESIDLLTRLWSGETTDFEGQHFKSTDMRIHPRPVQRPRPPILIAGSGDGTLRQVARQADVSNFFGNPASVPNRMETLDRICDEAGRPRNHILRSYYDYPVLAATRSAAESKLERVMDRDVIDYCIESGLLIVGTAEDAIAHYRALVAAGIQYFTVNIADTADDETLDLLATQVIPHLGG